MLIYHHFFPLARHMIKHRLVSVNARKVDRECSRCEKAGITLQTLHVDSAAVFSGSSLRYASQSISSEARSYLQSHCSDVLAFRDACK